MNIVFFIKQYICKQARNSIIAPHHPPFGILRFSNKIQLSPSTIFSDNAKTILERYKCICRLIFCSIPLDFYDTCIHSVYQRLGYMYKCSVLQRSGQSNFNQIGLWQRTLTKSLTLKILLKSALNLGLNQRTFKNIVKPR